MIPIEATTDPDWMYLWLDILQEQYGYSYDESITIIQELEMSITE